MTQNLSIIGAPSSAGAYAPGPERTPSAFRENGLIAALEQAGVTVKDRGDTEAFRWRPDPDDAATMNLDAGVRVAEQVADHVEAALSAGERALVLGGDCSIELGTLAGALRHQPSTGLVYIDLDVDLNAPGKGAGEGALGWMGAAHMLDVEGAEPRLASLGPRRPMLQPADILFFGADAITHGEAETIAARRLQVIGLDEVKRDIGAALARVAAWAGEFEQVLLHFDVDVMSFIEFPIAENTRRQGGLTFEELSESLLGLTKLPNWHTLTIAQANPNHAPDEAETFGRLNALLAECLGGHGQA